MCNNKKWQLEKAKATFLKEDLILAKFTASCRRYNVTLESSPVVNLIYQLLLLRASCTNKQTTEIRSKERRCGCTKYFYRDRPEGFVSCNYCQ